MYGFRCGNEKKKENKIKRTSDGVLPMTMDIYTHTQTVVALQNLYQEKRWQRRK